jgi:hypothetical protein
VAAKAPVKDVQGAVQLYAQDHVRKCMHYRMERRNTPSYGSAVIVGVSPYHTAVIRALHVDMADVEIVI